jgi:hypothetical protein
MFWSSFTYAMSLALAGRLQGSHLEYGAKCPVSLESRTGTAKRHESLASHTRRMLPSPTKSLFRGPDPLFFFPDSDSSLKVPLRCSSLLLSVFRPSTTRCNLPSSKPAHPFFKMSMAVSRMLPLQPFLALFFVVLLVVADAPLTSWSPSNSPFTRLAEDQLF